MGVVAPSFIPAVVMARQRRIVRKFQEAGADDASRARTPQEVGVSERHLFRRLVGVGVMTSAGDGRYYLNGEGLESWQRRRRIIGLAALAALLAGMLVALAVAAP